MVIIQAIALIVLSRAIQNQTTQEVQAQINASKAILNNDFSQRVYFLNAFAETVAKDFGLKQFFQEDNRTFLVALNNHRQRIDADMAISLSEDKVITNQVVRQIDPNGQQRLVRGEQIGKSLASSSLFSDESKLMLVNNVVYKMTLSPLKSGTKTFGWIGFGFAIDTRLARYYAETIGFSINFLIQQNDNLKILAYDNETTYQESLSKNIVDNKIPNEFIGDSILLEESENFDLAVVFYKSKEDLLVAIKRRWLQLVLLGLFTLFLSLGGAYLIAKSITKPVKLLVEQAQIIARGNYQQVVQINEQGELAQLASEFGVMQKAILQREQAIRYQAYYDALTELPNRNALNQELQNFTFDKSKPIGLYLINLRNMRDVNDTMGHEFGDQVIKGFSEKLSTFKTNFFIAYMGADEFVLLDKHFQPDSIELTIQQLEHTLTQPIDIKKINLHLNIRVGIAFYPTHGDLSSLLQKADTALHIARKTHQVSVLYDPALDQNTPKRFQLMSELKQAIQKEQLTLFYQPKVNLKKNRVTHVEALVRWQHPNLGMIPPDSFIPFAEQSGQIKPLSNWVLKTAAKQYQEWQAQNINLSIAVNISAQDINDDDFFNHFYQVVKKHNLPHHAITLEVTESAVVQDVEKAIQVLKTFKNQGTHLSIDDYGTGYSSLAQLKHLPLHELKIDKSFVQQLPNNADDAIIVQSTIELSHNMGLSVVAEGVETQEAMDWLRKNACEFAQGYFISRPLPADKFNRWLLESEYFLDAKATI
ncbi:MAG: EAL domain-containing protein [Pseudomonadota bacterium]